MNNKFFLGVVCVFLAVLLMAGGFASGYLVGRHPSVSAVMPAVSQTKAKPALGLVQEVIDLVEHAYVEKVSTDQMIIGAIRGVLKSLNDPYSHYFSPTDFNMVKEETTGRFFGVGIELGMKDNRLVVVSTIDDTPAFKAGIKAGDFIIKIDEKSTEGMTSQEAVPLIRGAEGTPVKLTMEREGVSKPLVFKMIRAEIKIANVKSKLVDGKIGYIRLHSFTEGCGADIKKAVAELKDKGAEGIILDLRGNPGGLLSESVSVASVFIDKGTIVSIKKRSGKENSYSAQGGADVKTPLVILVDKGSASASEIVAGAVKDYERGALVGERTFGKGSVQTMTTLSNGGGLIITTAVYMTPKGTVIHKKGIEPDVLIKTPKEITAEKDPQLDKAKEIINDIFEGKDWKKKAA